MKRRLSPEEIEAYCAACGAKCCRYFTMPLDAPDNPRACDRIRWYLSHEHTSVAVSNDRWFLVVDVRCRHLQPDKRCAIYDRRPEICRKHDPRTCEGADGRWYDELFRSVKEFDRYR